MNSKWIVALTFALLILLSSQPTASDQLRSLFSYDDSRPKQVENTMTSATPGIIIDATPYIIIQALNTSITSHGFEIAKVLEARGIVTKIISADEITASVISGSPAIILDASMGADNGSLVSNSLLSSLLQCDAPLILLGRSAWILHRLKNRGSPSHTAFSSNTLFTTPAYEKAVFFYYPNTITSGDMITTENEVALPLDIAQTEHSRLVNLTSADAPERLPVLRYDSWPLDMFLLSAESPTRMTESGIDLLVNLLAYVPTLKESSTSITVRSAQASHTDVVEGGFSYFHTPRIEAIYHAVHIAYEVLNGQDWISWLDNNSGMIENALDRLYLDDGVTANFYTSLIDGKVTNTSIANGLWIASIIGSKRFNISLLADTLASKQMPEGGFEDSITVTYYVLESLNYSGSLSAIDTVSLESWLRDCVIDGGDTPNPDFWGGVSYNPSSLSPSNSYAAQYVLSLQILGKSHNDPYKLTEWILDQTSNGDGSYTDKIPPSIEIVRGTANALTTMSVLGTLAEENRTNGISWLTSVQLPSGGFGRDKWDQVGKLIHTDIVATCLVEIGASTAGLIDFVEACRSEVGFENMEPIPSLMWSYWIAKTARYAHSFQITNMSSISDYLEMFSRWSEYPDLVNITTHVPQEYASYISSTQYFDLSVWSQLFGVELTNACGFILDNAMRTSAISQIQQCQASSGHFRPMDSFIWTPSMQYSVAAIEALNLLDGLDSISYRTQLESAVMNEYQSGRWSSQSWTILPFAKKQSAIDYLSTRTALRLDLITTAMANEIASVIANRVQYDDLWALSRDVATIALLNSSFTISLDIFNISLIEDLLQNSFIDGWFNSTDFWQPVFTADVLEMVSILGLRLRLMKPTGQNIAITSVGYSHIGQGLSIDISINSTKVSHTVQVSAFNEIFKFDNVANSDTLIIQVPQTQDVLGSSNISIMLNDYGDCRAFARTEVNTTGSLNGSLEVFNSSALIGDMINSTVTWALDTGKPAGPTNLTVRVGNQSFYKEWYYYDQVSSFNIEIPTSDLTEGNYDLNVILDRAWCESLLISEPIVLNAPRPTYFVADSVVYSELSTSAIVNWSLHFQENGSFIASQTVNFEVYYGSTLVYSASDKSIEGVSTFNWTPDTRGTFTYRLLFSRNGTIESSEFSGDIIVSEPTRITWQNVESQNQYSNITVNLTLSTLSGENLSDEQILINVRSPTGAIIMDDYLITDINGQIEFTIYLGENGVYSINANFAGTLHLQFCDSNDNIVSWSSSNLQLTGIPSDTLVDQSYLIGARLLDSMNYSLSSETLILIITYLPSTQIINITLTTSQDGTIAYNWTPDTAGSYKIESIYEGSISRGSASIAKNTDTYIPLMLTVEVGTNLQVGIQSWIDVLATNHLSTPVTNILVNVTTQGLSISGLTDDDGHLNVSWTPDVRGSIIINTSSSRQLWYESASSINLVEVCESSALLIEWDGPLRAVDNATLQVQLVDSLGYPVFNMSISTQLFLDGEIFFDNTDITNEHGIIIISFTLSHPGTLSVISTFDSQDFLLSSTNQISKTVLGITEININPTSPLIQTSTRGIIISLINWQGVPLSNSEVSFSIRDSDETVIYSSELITDADGICVISYTFNNIGDFMITASYPGADLNAPAEIVQIQQVYVTPNFKLSVAPSVILGETLSIDTGILDKLGQYISGRNLTMSIYMNDTLVFQSVFLSNDGTTQTHWTPAARGLARIMIYHSPSFLYLENSTNVYISVLEMVSANLALSADNIDLFTSVEFVYQMAAESDVSNIQVDFALLGIDLLPVWSSTTITDENGTARMTYFANHTTGMLTLRVEPHEEYFTIGGSQETQLTVMTNCSLSVQFMPSPPSLGDDVIILISAHDDLGGIISGVSVTVWLSDPYGVLIKLGTWSNSINLVLENGAANLTFTPSVSGLYRVELQSQETTTVHSAYHESSHTVYCPINLNITLSNYDILVGQTVTIVVRMTDYWDSIMAGFDLTVEIIGPGTKTIGPVTLTTNSSGYVTWVVSINDQGFWTIIASFDGAGVYLSSNEADNIDARYGTLIHVQAQLDTVIASETVVSLSVLLTDSNDAPLEGFSLGYSIYHSEFGPVNGGLLMQSSNMPEKLNLTFPYMGNYSIIFIFNGTAHYHPSNTAIELFVFGTTTVSFESPKSFDRALNASVRIICLNEMGETIEPSQLNIEILLENGTHPIDVSSRLMSDNNWTGLSVFKLPVGQYHLSISVANTPTRIGTHGEFTFNITTVSKIMIQQASADGILGHEQYISLIITDSLDIPLDSVDVSISLYDPLGNEILGSPLSSVTKYETNDGVIEVSWTPTLTGNYSLVVSYEGNEFISSCDFQITTLSRYQTDMEVDVDWVFTFGNPVRATITLSSPTAKVSNVEIEVKAFLEGMCIIDTSIPTSFRGIATIQLHDLPAGLILLNFSFNGDSNFAPAYQTRMIKVQPIVDVFVAEVISPYLGSNCTVCLNISILGPDMSWTGLLSYKITRPDNRTQLGQIVVGSTGSISLTFHAEVIGVYSINLTISGIPAIATYHDTFNIVIESAPIPLMVDAATTPVFTGGLVLPLIGLFVRKRLNRIIESLPSDWDE